MGGLVGQANNYRNQITEVLHRFYKCDAVDYEYDCASTPFTEEDYKSLESGNYSKGEVETIEDNERLELDDEFLSVLTNAWADYHKTHKLNLGFAIYDGDYQWGLTLFGTREETDEEFNNRIEKQKNNEQKRKEQAKKKKEKAKQNKEAKLQQLAKELGKTIV